MKIKKRDGSEENYTQQKIISAITKSFISVNSLGHQRDIEQMVLEIEAFVLEHDDKRDVEVFKILLRKL